jgi:hypothetical protein
MMAEGQAKVVNHGLGFCPVIWVQNMPVQDETDGAPDCPKYAYDLVRGIDMLTAQAHRGLIYNADPTLLLTTKAEMGTISKGSDNALRVPDGNASYLELTGTSAKACMEQADEYRRRVLECSQCVLEHPEGTTKTATEVEKLYQSMVSKADLMREQYGQRCVVPLLEMMYQAAVKVLKPTQGAEGIVRGEIKLPPKYQKNPETGAVEAVQLQPGTGGVIGLRWPGYFSPSLDDITKAATAAAGAKSGGLIDDETAINFVAPYFKVEDKGDLVDKVRANVAKQQAEMDAMSLSGGGYDTEDASPTGEPAALE